MKIVRQFLTVILPAMLLNACVSTAPIAEERPAWIENPGAGVAVSANTNIYGKVAQENLAINRARDALANKYPVSLAQEVVIANRNVIDTGMGGINPNSKVTFYTHGVIKAKWLDKISDKLWIWMVPDNF